MHFLADSMFNICYGCYLACIRFCVKLQIGEDKKQKKYKSEDM